MNAPRQPAGVETIAADQKTRLALAARIAAGMMANPNVYASTDYRGTVARESLAVADRIILLAATGGC